MADKVSLLTDWVTVGRSGPTIDGREITEAQIKDCAETYNPDDYTAVLNYEHYFGNFGTVRELRTAPAPGGKIALQARLQPNAAMLALNKESSKVFTSMELVPNFAGTGKWYLSGLALTDTPASLGTTELKFSKTPEGKRPVCSEALEVDPASFCVAPATEPDEGLMKKAFAILAPLFASKTQEPQAPKDPAMSAEQLKKLEEGQTALTAAVTKLTETFAAKPPVADKAPTAAAAEPSKAEVPGITKEQFSTLEKNTADLAASVQKLTATVEAAMKGQPGTKPPPHEGSADADEAFV